ncbi:MAG: 50S ribosomal protein L29 [Desulfobacteraceae bacterium]|nr:50S ribosomal protein L29 [Desulfobacteraceae bacterium]
MKASEIRELSRDEMQRKIADLKEELFNLRFQHATNQLENSQKMKMVRRDIARIKTVVREFESEAEEV